MVPEQDFLTLKNLFFSLLWITKYIMAITRTNYLSEVTSQSDENISIRPPKSKIPQIHITNQKLNKNNHIQWSQSIKMIICG